ncbi:nucleotidyl transferase AbiEii/AbiGii toxin family protein [Marinibactrum halimedae]|uniref:Nucleotidyltransferase family protein n=1 Tax=Marinibactrum halimedae TaxID=1444977 RepID=A0AA37WPT2_9GAMM|nr:nucleotidyl transferase AbiEii/AbiGii toxin family protein [Marinibactrum halimedae]MCD9459234.1 nucleotidyl transferase AbiEii/AbiGii toxin family protein [Marinibactrum halimedae]GLS27306.1 hypothetical protein GCM10007877_30250 [Marinibactrum halimedae]
MKENIQNLQMSYELSSQQVEDAVNPLEVAALFEKEHVSYVLIGGHMLSFYTGTARATVDVDFIIGGPDFPRATKAIDKAYAQFRQNDRIYHVTYDSKKSGKKDLERIDLVRDGFPLFREIVIKYCHTISAHKHTIKIPTIEAAIALKFAASISPNRGDENKPVDNADLLKLVRSESNIKEDALIKLGNLVYQGGGKELVSIVADIKAGKAVSL